FARANCGAWIPPRSCDGGGATIVAAPSPRDVSPQYTTMSTHALGMMRTRVSAIAGTRISQSEATESCSESGGADSTYQGCDSGMIMSDFSNTADQEPRYTRPVPITEDHMFILPRATYAGVALTLSMMCQPPQAFAQGAMLAMSTKPNDASAPRAALALKLDHVATVFIVD